MAELVLRSGKRAGKRISLPATEVVVGRDEGCHIRLTSSDISRRHCILRTDGDTLVVADLGSRNGTHVNDIAIKAPTALKPGDLLRVGPFLFQVPGGEGDANPEADISGWLTEEGTLSGAKPANAGNDTTLVPDLSGGASTAEMKQISADEATKGQAKEAPPDPIVEQAAEVIRGYWAAKKTKR